MELITLKKATNFPSEIDERKIHFILHKIIGKSLFSNNKDEEMIKGELPANQLKQMIGNSYKKHLDFLLKDESKMPILFTDNQYIKGEKSKTYSINPNLLRHGLTSYHLKNGAIKRNLINQALQNTRTELDHFSFDHESAIKELENIIAISGNLKLWTQLYVINSIRLKNYWYFRDKKGKRLHHPFASLKSELRKHITIDHMPLIGIDLKNAQPFLLASILNHCFCSPNKQMGLFLTETPLIEEITRTYDLVKKNSLIEFIKHSIEGTLYEQIKTKLENRKSKNWTRKEVKNKFIINLFSNQENLFTRVLNEEYPDVMHFIRKVHKENRSALAILLQRLESYLFLDNIAKEVASSVTSKFYTIHDSIYVKPPYLEAVKEICKRKTLDVTGFTGTFTTD